MRESAHNVHEHGSCGKSTDCVLEIASNDSMFVVTFHVNFSATRALNKQSDMMKEYHYVTLSYVSPTLARAHKTTPLC